MALTNSQYESIMRGYSEQQSINRAELGKRRAYVLEHIPEYHALEEEAAKVSVSYGNRLLSGEEHSMDALHEALKRISEQKKQLLLGAGLDEDYLTAPCRCKECGDTGFVGNKKCRCFQQQEIALLYSSSGLNSLENVPGFSGVRTDYYTGEDKTRFENVLNRSRQFVEQFRTGSQNLLFYGTVGTGKSLLSACIAKELLQQGHSVMYFSAVTFFEVLGDATFHGREESYDTNLIYGCDLLIIDDLGTEMVNRFTLQELFQCINERALRQKSTIISTNLTLEEIQATYADRIFSRIIEHFDLFRFTGPDIRVLRKVGNGTEHIKTA